jgi:hypothetical protein
MEGEGIDFHSGWRQVYNIFQSCSMVKYVLYSHILYRKVVHRAKRNKRLVHLSLPGEVPAKRPRSGAKGVLAQAGKLLERGYHCAELYQSAELESLQLYSK